MAAPGPVPTPVLMKCPDCSRLVLRSPAQVHTAGLSAVRLVQNGRHFFVSALPCPEILLLADVPYLDFDQDFAAFCDFTVAAKGSATGLPHLWQRPLDADRVSSIATWLDSNAGNCIPDAVTIGEKADYISNPCIKLIPTAGYSGTAYSITVENRLRPSCSAHSRFGFDDGTPAFQNRCNVHGCPEHESSTSPLQIIDGQHRLQGLWGSNVAAKEVAAVFLLLPRPRTQHYPEVKGFLADAQAEIFRQVNTESKPLEELHQLWLHRFYERTWAATRPDSFKAYDILIDLGGTGLARLGTTNPMQNQVQAHPKRRVRYYIDTLRGARNAKDEDGAVAEIVGRLAHPAPNVPTAAQQLQNYILASTRTMPDMWAAPGNSLAPFQSSRLFEAVVRLFPRFMEWARHLGLGALSVHDFEQIWDLQAPNFDPLSVDAWREFRGTGEDPAKEFAAVLSMMWPAPCPGVFITPSCPTWETEIGSPGSPGACPDWKTYITLRPDPLVWIQPATSVSAGSTRKLAAASVTAPAPAAVQIGDTLRWEPPRNAHAQPEVSFRVRSTQWVELDGTGSTRQVPPAWAGAAGTLYELRVTYGNIIGKAETILEFVV